MKMFYEESPVLDIRQYQGYDEKEILGLYNSVGWTAYTEYPEVLKAAIMCSYIVYAAYMDGKLVGIARAVGDGLTVVLIQDVLVLPEYQRRGVGTALMKAMLVRFPRVRQVYVCTDDTEETTAFYESLGMKPIESMGCRCFIRTGEWK